MVWAAGAAAESGSRDDGFPRQPAIAAAPAIATPRTGSSATGGPPARAAVFRPIERAVSTWRSEAADHLLVTPAEADALRGPGAAPAVARCVKLNNYWCIKSAGWNGEIAADGEGHVAFASATEGAAVAALLLKRYYVDFGRKSANAIISHWAPAQCGLVAGGATRGRARPTTLVAAATGLAATLRGRWLASHRRGFVAPIAGARTRPRRSVVDNHVARMMPTPTIAEGMGETTRSTRPMTLDALLMGSRNPPPSRSMLGLPRRTARESRGSDLVLGAGSMSVSSCGTDSARVASYAVEAAAGIVARPDGDLALFRSDGTAASNLAKMMANMARVEIGPLGVEPDLIEKGIAAAFAAGRQGSGH